MEENAKSCKIVLLGESGVGKTSIIDRFINDKFEDEGISTIAASFVDKTMTFEEFQGKSVKFEIWDTAGQEKYRSLNKIFYKKTGAAILVYDITNKQSFEELKNYWYQQIKEFAPKDISKKLYKLFYFYFYFFLLVIGIAGNKGDLFDREAVKEEEVKIFAKEIDAIFRLTSACTSFGIKELFKSIGLKILDPNFKNDEKNIEKSGNNGANNRGVKLEVQKDKNDIKKKKNCC